MNLPALRPRPPNFLKAHDMRGFGEQMQLEQVGVGGGGGKRRKLRAQKSQSQFAATFCRKRPGHQPNRTGPGTPFSSKNRKRIAVACDCSSQETLQGSGGRKSSFRGLKIHLRHPADPDPPFLAFLDFLAFLLLRFYDFPCL